MMRLPRQKQPVTPPQHTFWTHPRRKELTQSHAIIANGIERPRTTANVTPNVGEHSSTPWPPLKKREPLSATFRKLDAGYPERKDYRDEQCKEYRNKMQYTHVK